MPEEPNGFNPESVASQLGDALWQAVPGQMPTDGRAGRAVELAEGRLESAQRLDLLSAWVREYAIYSLDAGGVVTSWSPEAEHLKGYRAEEIVGCHFSVLFPPERREEGAPGRLLVQAAVQGSVVDEGWRVRKDGTRFWAHVVITALRSADGRVRGFVKITRDDSESQDRLQRAVRRFADLFALTPAGIALFDQAERVVDANPALCRLLGFELDRLVGMGADELLHTADGAEELIPSCPSWSEGAVTERVLAHREGRPVHCELQCAMAEQDDGHPFFMVVFTDVTERIRHAEQLRHRATHDALTGLRNRAGIAELLQTLLSPPSSGRAGVLSCDIINFKRINDSAGHQAGDRLLHALALRLESHLPSGCVPGRLDGDEFAVVCPDVDEVGGIEELATRVSSLLRTAVPVDGRSARVSASVGAAVQGGSLTDTESLMRAAGAAMSEAKHCGPGRIALAAPGRTDYLGRQLELENELDHAIDAGELELHFQPVVAPDGTVLCAEALVRWPHPRHGLLGPGAFLPVAEQADLLGDLDRWVLEAALAEAATWPSSRGRPVGIAVNLAGLLPADPQFVDEVGSITERTGVDPDRVILEVVENALIDLPDRSRDAMHALAERGVRFAIDDFGTGYSTLARLITLPTHILKADRQFVARLGADHSALAVIKAVVDLAHALGHHCVAEGVETPDQFHTLADLGVHGYQGWLFSQALPAHRFRDLLNRSPLPIPAHH